MSVARHALGSTGPANERLRFNAPNALCLIRLAGSLLLIAVALSGKPRIFLAAFLSLIATDWLDGRLANWFRQRTSFGARLDSVADGALYGGLLFGCFWLKSEALYTAGLWIAAALGTFVVSCAVALAKFHRLPSYHTYSAKLAAAITVLAAAALLLDWAIWPLRTAAIAVSWANLESTLITIVSARWKVDVPTVWQAIQPRS